MHYRLLGRTGIQISNIAFGAGPVSGLMTGSDPEAQSAVVRRAVESGINWFDTAAGYGQGASETNLGIALQAISKSPTENPPSGGLHVATKVRISPQGFHDIRGEVRRSVEESLQRLQLSKVSLLQLHNGITGERNEEPASVSPADILGAEGIARAMHEMQSEGLIDHVGLTGTGQPGALRQVIRSGEFDTMQLPYHVLNPSAGEVMPVSFRETNYGNIIADCAETRMGVLAIRVFAAGALLGHAPSAHTKVTPYFPIILYERDVQRAEQLAVKVPHLSMKELSVRYVLSHPSIHAAIVGFGEAEQVDEVVNFAEAGALSEEVLQEVAKARIDS